MPSSGSQRPKPPALTSTLQSVPAPGKPGVADPYLLRVAKRSWADLGFSDPPEPAAAAAKHQMVMKFFSDFSKPDRVDEGVPISSAGDPKLFRIKSGDWRAAVRYLPDDGVQWLCRAVALANFTVENHAYNALADLEAADQMLPDEDERALARGDQFLVSAVRALRAAMSNADAQAPSGVPAGETRRSDWHMARAARPTGDQHPIGQVCVERLPEDAEMESVYRYWLTLRQPPSDVKVRADWIAFVAAFVFPADDPIEAAYPPKYTLPPGANLRQGELPLVQARLEEL